MPDHDDRTQDFQPVGANDSILNRIEEFEQRWRSGAAPRIEDYLGQTSADKRGDLLEELIATEVQLRRGAGEAVSPEQYRSRFTNQADRISRGFELAEAVSLTVSKESPTETRSFVGASPEETADHLNGEPGDDRPPGAETAPTQLGRYRIETLLGKGGFGRVFLAHDGELQRPVAIKVASKVVDEEDAEAYLAEARTVATLDHPQILRQCDGGNVQAVVWMNADVVDSGRLCQRTTAENKVRKDGGSPILCCRLLDSPERGESPQDFDSHGWQSRTTDRAESPLSWLRSPGFVGLGFPGNARLSWRHPFFVLFVSFVVGPLRNTFNWRNESLTLPRQHHVISRRTPRP